MTHIDTYRRAAPGWDRKIGRLGYQVAYADFLRGRVRSDGPVLDVGTGTGAFASAWLGAGGSRDLTLLDASAPMLARAGASMRRFGCQPVCVEADATRFAPARSFRAVLAAHVLEHVEDPRALLRNMADWVAPGGMIYLVVSRPHWCNWLIWLRFRHRWYDARTVLQWASNAGLQDLAVERFRSGPPSRTSLAYHFVKPERTPTC